jgi:phytoene desaturase
MKNAVVVGAGIAGLAAAIRLKMKGYAVVVYDRNPYPGGKLTEIRQKGYRFDAGPSLFTLPEQVDALFELAGETASEHFEYLKLETVCHYFWNDGTFLPASGDPETFARQASACFQVPASRIRNYLHKSAFIYNTTAPVFLDQSLHRWRNYLNFRTLKGILTIPWLGVFGNLHRENRALTGDPKLTQLFDRYATYNGSDPYRAPGVLRSIPHLEFNRGAWFPKGGMHRITLSLYELAQRIGVEFQLNTPVDEIVIHQNKVRGIRIGTRMLEADQVVCNADVYTAYRNLLKGLKAPERTLSQPRSSSALIFYWGIRKVFPQLQMHNIFFSDNYRDEFSRLFEGREMSADPTIYINITSIHEPSDAPQGCMNWFVMINVPGNTGQNWDRWIARARKNILDKLSRHLGEAIEPLIDTEAVLDPRSIEQRSFSHQGSLYGNSSNTRMAAFLRHPNFSKRIPNLWFCGGSVHPGGGIPLCLKSAQIVASHIPKP